MQSAYIVPDSAREPLHCGGQAHLVELRDQDPWKPRVAQLVSGSCLQSACRLCQRVLQCCRSCFHHGASWNAELLPTYPAWHAGLDVVGSNARNFLLIGGSFECLPGCARHVIKPNLHFLLKKWELHLDNFEVTFSTKSFSLKQYQHMQCMHQLGS